MEISKADMELRKDLQRQIAELEQALIRRKRMLLLLGDDCEQKKPFRPRTKPWLLRDYLERFEPDGIPIKDVPHALKEMGFVTKEVSPTTNWLRQLKPELNFFNVCDGRVKLRTDLPQIDSKYGHTKATSETDKVPTEVTA